MWLYKILTNLIKNILEVGIATVYYLSHDEKYVIGFGPLDKKFPAAPLICIFLYTYCNVMRRCSVLTSSGDGGSWWWQAAP